MTEFDDDFVPLAVEVLTEDGADATFRVYAAASYDPKTGKTTVGANTDYAAKIIPPFSYEERNIDGDKIRMGDMQSGVAASGLAFASELLKLNNPDNRDTIIIVIIGGVEWSIVSVKPIISGNETALYMLQLRK